MQDPLDSELAEEAADEAMGAGEAWDEDAFEAGGEDHGLELDDEDAFEDDGMDESASFDDQGFDDEASLESAFEDEADGYDDAWDDGFDALDDGFDAEDGDAIEDAFAEAMDEEDEEEFLRRALGRLRRLARSPIARAVLTGAMPIAQRLIRRAAQRAGLGGAVGTLPGGPGLTPGIPGGRPRRRRPPRVDAPRPRPPAPAAAQPVAQALDAFADFAADQGDEALDVFVPVAAGLAARYAVRATPARGRPAEARAVGRAVMRAAQAAAREITGRFGARAVRILPRVVRQVVAIVRRQGASPRAVAPMIRRAGRRVAASPRAARRLAQPSPAARQLRRGAGVGTRGPAGPMRADPGAGGTRPRRVRRVGAGQYEIRGPVRLVFGS